MNRKTGKHCFCLPAFVFSSVRAIKASSSLCFLREKLFNNKSNNTAFPFKSLYFSKAFSNYLRFANFFSFWQD